MTHIPHDKPTFGQEEVDAVIRVVSHGQWSAGRETRELEAAFTGFSGRKFAVMVGSYVAAVRLSLMALGVEPGDEIILPAYCPVELPNGVLAAGAVPVTIDIDEESRQVDLDQVPWVMSDRTRAVIIPHLFGCPVEFSALKMLKLPVIEDCSHGLGSGSMGRCGDLVILSLDRESLIGGNGGAVILTDNEEFAHTVKENRSCIGLPASPLRLGDQPNDITAALARVQLRRLPEIAAARKVLADEYLEALAELEGEGLISLPLAVPGRVWRRFIIQVNDDAVQWTHRLRVLGISAFPPLLDYRNGGDKVKLYPTPVSDEAYRTLLSLPSYPGLRATEFKRIVEAVVSLAG